MTRLAARSTKILVLAGLALAVTASGGSAASAKRSSMLSAVRHARRPAARMTAAHHPAKLKFDASYESLINRYFTDVAHDSGLTSNVYSVATQYSDGTGPIEYQSTFGGSYVDHDPLPASGCKDGQHSPCLTDKQLQTEIQHVLKANGWHGGTGNIFFLMTPNGVGSCVDSFGAQCSSNYFCAYHSSFTDSNNEPVIYADEPYEGEHRLSDLRSGSSPNSDDADTTINTISHEQNEAITDPFDTLGWLVANDQIGTRGPTSVPGRSARRREAESTEYNQVINGDHYWLQQEWSNADTRLRPVPRRAFVSGLDRQRAARLPRRAGDAHEHDVRDLLASGLVAGRHEGAAHLRERPDRTAADREQGVVERPSGHVQLPVAPLQRQRRIVHPDQPRDALDLSAEGAGRPASASRTRQGPQLRGKQDRDLGRHSTRPGREVLGVAP